MNDSSQYANLLNVNNQETVKSESDSQVDKSKNNNQNDESRINLQDTKIHNKSSVIKYIVQDGETLHNISEKFSVPKRLIKSSNQLSDHHVHPGDTLKIYLDVQSLDEIGPISVSLFDPSGKSNHVKGKLMIKDYNLMFHPHSITHHQLKINLFGHLESLILQNPDNKYFASSHHRHHHLNFGDSDSNVSEESEIKGPASYSVLSIEYSNDQNQITTNYFIGKKEDIEIYQNELGKISKMTKETPDEYKPNQIYDAINSKSFITKQRVHHNSISYHLSKKLNKEESIKNSSPSIPHPIPQPEPALIGISLNGKSNIFDDESILNIRKQLPKMYRNSDWNCLFKTRIHGYSLSTLFNKTAHKSPLLLIIKTTDNEIVGVFISCLFMISDKYYGNGETFMFRFQPKFETFRWDLRKPMCNRYFILSSLDCISFGASNEEGEGSALYIDNHMCYGYSEVCDTYCSPQLTSTKKFQIDELEIWGIGYNSDF